ncbi:plasmid partitioning protein RepB [Fluviibacterium sp. DFM31]|uniref:Plasmid partitioning protein RepB n=1 Tax=Meridianimarinicoccus marinus TaxID=3231483 RepID=A0ABV3LEP3_9RHOB
MARKSLKDMAGIANTIARSSPSSGEKAAKTNAPVLGALQGSLAAIREIDAELIDDWGPIDRMNEFTTVNSDDDDESFEALKSSIRDGGQQVPILVRRAKSGDRFEAIYGRRRLKACRELGIKVRANVQDVDDATALLAKGLENAARRNLSFYEKARFAEAIQDAGHDMATTRQVLNLSASSLSHLMKVVQNVPRGVGDLIGAAPRSGRPKWTELAELFQAGKLSEDSAKNLLGESEADVSSDDRLDRLLKEATKRGPRPATGPSEVSPVNGVTIKSGPGSVSLSAKRTGDNAAFADWLDKNLSEIIKKSYAEFTAVNRSDET